MSEDETHTDRERMLNALEDAILQVGYSLNILEQLHAEARVAEREDQRRRRTARPKLWLMQRPPE